MPPKSKKSSTSAPKPQKRVKVGKPSFNSMLIKLEDFTKKHNALPVHIKASNKGKSSSSSKSSKVPASNPSEESELRLWLDRQLRQQHSVAKIVKPWINETG